MVKYNWLSLKNQFITGDWVTISDFLRDKGIKDNSRNRLHTKNWILERKEYQEEIYRKAREELIEKKVNVRIRQAEKARKMQEKGEESLNTLEPTTIEEARRLIVSGLREERAALGISEIEKGSSSSNLTQVNVSLPKTRFDEIIDGQDFEGILRLLAEVKKEKERRKKIQWKNSDFI